MTVAQHKDRPNGRSFTAFASEVESNLQQPGEMPHHGDLTLMMLQPRGVPCRFGNDKDV